MSESTLNPTIVGENVKPLIGKVLHCFHCGNKTSMQCVAQYENEWHSEEDGYWERSCWSIYFCPVCSQVTLEEKSECNGAYDHEGKLIPFYKVLFPSVTTDSTIPANVRKAFEAALKVKNIDGAICLLSLRRTLEMLCKDKGAIKGTLFDKLKKLASTGVLPPILDQMAGVLKELGNMAAHADNKEFPETVVSSMVDFTNAILTYVYVLPAKLASIQTQLQRKSSVEPFEE
jgi:hypothetical protein